MDHLTVPTREQAASLDQCAEFPHIIPQWRAADGTDRGVWLRALTFRDRMLAERAATGKDGKADPWRLVAEEVARGVIRPAGLTVDSILGWNADVIFAIHDRLQSLGGVPAASLAAELARIAGGTAPEPGGVAGGPDDAAHDVGDEPEPAAADPAHEPVGALDG